METSVELAGLASAAAARLIDLLATDGWAAVKSSVLSLWRSAHPERVEEEVEVMPTRNEVLRDSPMRAVSCSRHSRRATARSSRGCWSPSGRRASSG